MKDGDRRELGVDGKGRSSVTPGRVATLLAVDEIGNLAARISIAYVQQKMCVCVFDIIIHRMGSSLLHNTTYR